MTSSNTLMMGVSSTGDVSMSFATSMLQLQSELLRRPNIKTSLDIVDTLNEALVRFSDNPEYDTLLAIDSKSSVDAGFFFDRDAGKDFVVAAYPTGSIDWDRVAAKIQSTTEDDHLVGIKYNVTPTKGTTVSSTKYVVVPSAGLKILRITRKVIDTLKRTHPDIGTAFHAMGCVDGKTLGADERLCALWGGPVYADVQHKTSTHATVTYGPGCIAWRSQVR